MKIEILTIGDEILSGNILDTNTAYLSDKFWMHGFEVAYHSGVRDDADTIQEALLLAAGRADAIVVTGGLGPTADDFTLEIAAKTFKKKMALDKSYLHYLENLFKQWGRAISENNKKQAYVPEGAVTYRNRVGTAPGVGMVYKKKHFYFLPGVPKEMKQIFEDSVLPEIVSLQKQRTFFESKLIKCFGAAESALDQALSDLYVKRLNIKNVRVGFRAHFPETFIKLSAWDKSKDGAAKILKDAESEVRNRIGQYAYGEGEDTLESVLGELLKKKKKTIGLAESCTGGMIAQRLTRIPGSSDYFKGGVVSYSDESKEALLGVSADTVKKHGAVSSQCAIEMAQGARRALKTDYAISVTGIAGPSGGTPAKPVGTVHVALAGADGTREKKYSLPRNREWFQLLVSSIALDTLRRELKE